MDLASLLECFIYTPSYEKIVRLGLIDLEPWYILDNDMLLSKTMGLRERYPYMQLAPFAQRVDRDDVACFVPKFPGKVQIIHDYASPGWEQRKTYDDFWVWFREAIEEMIYFE